MSLKHTYLTILICLWFISGMLLNAQQPEKDCSTATVLKKELMELNLEKSKDLSEEILDNLKKLSTQEIIETCWDDGVCKLIGENIASLLINNSKKPEMIIKIVGYVKFLRETLTDCISSKKENGAKHKAIVMFNSLVNPFQDKKPVIDGVSLLFNFIEITNDHKIVLDQIEKIEKSLLMYAENRNNFLSEPFDAAKAKKTVELQVTTQVLDKIQEKYPAIHVLEDQTFLRVIALFCLFLLVLLGLFLFYMTRLDKAITKLKEFKKSLTEDNQFEDRGETMSDGNKDIDLKNLKINFKNIQRLGKTLVKLQDEIQSLKEKIVLYQPANTAIQEIQNELVTIKNKINHLESSTPNIPSEKAEELSSIPSSSPSLSDRDINSDENKIKSLEAKPFGMNSQFIKEAVVAEREVLKEIWKGQPFDATKKQLMALVKDDPDRDSRMKACFNLEGELNFYPEFSSFYTDLLKPLQKYYFSINEINKTLDTISKKEISVNPIEDLLKIRQKINFLVFMQYRDEIPELLHFNVEKWFEEKFLNFADQFIRKYQKEVNAETLSSEMRNAYNKINQILRDFGIEAIPIILGETTFSEKIHIGLSRIYETSMNDGVIANVVKNGFKRINGNVIIQPEVIVNRLT